jgi:hypothetical protein
MYERNKENARGLRRLEEEEKYHLQKFDIK